MGVNTGEGISMYRISTVYLPCIYRISTVIERVKTIIFQQCHK